MNIRLTGILPLVLLTACMAQAQGPAWRFDTDGDMQGWAAHNFVSAEVRGGYLRGVTKYDPMLVAPVLELDAAKYRTIEFRAQTNLTGGGEIFWHGPGGRYSEERMSRHVLQAGPEPLVYRIDLGACAGWEGTITGLRLDLLNPEGAEIALDYVRFLDREPGAVPNDSFEDDFDGDGVPDGWTVQNGSVTLAEQHATDGGVSAKVTADAGKAVLRARAPLDLLGLYHISADLTAEGTVGDARVSLIFYDVFGKKLPDAPFVMSAGRQATGRRLESDFTAPPLAATADVVLTVEGAKATAWWDNVVLRHVREELDLNAAPLETWRASWIWATETYGKDNSPAYLRKAFDLAVAPAQLTEARAQVTADDSYKLWINGQPVTETSDTDGWRTPEMIDLRPYLQAGRNVMAVEARDVSSAEGFLLEGALQGAGVSLELTSDGNWKAAGEAPEGWEAPGFDDAGWKPAKVIAAAGGPPWGHLPFEYLGQREPVKLLKAEVPARLTAGETLTAAAVLEKLPEAAKMQPLRFAFLRDGETIFTRALGPEAIGKSGTGVRLTVSLPVTRFLATGKYQVALGYPYTGYGTQGLVIGSVDVIANSRPEPPVRAEIRRHRGLPTLFLNGQPNSFMHYLENRVTAAHITNMARNGLHLYQLAAEEIGWLGPDQYDYSAWDRSVLELLTYDPQAVIMPTFDVSGLRHRFWMDAHPEELCRDASGSDTVGIYNAGGKIISLASERWKQDYAVAVKRFVEHCRQAPWGGRIVAYQPCSGVSWEWQHWGSVGAFEPTDYSEPMQQAFRQWTRQKYGEDVAKLRQAWNQTEVTFDTVAIPSVAQRDAADHLAFRDPAKSGYVIDFYRFFQDIMVDGIEDAFRTVKEAAPQTLTGTYYGYTVTMLSGARRAGDSGHFALSRLLDSKLCDFLVSPFDYAQRGLGQPYTVMSPIGSVLARDKLWVLQADLRTHLVTDPAQRRHGSPDSLEGTVSQLERAFANATTKGSATQWYDFSHGWIARDPRQGQVIGKLREIGEQWVQWPERGPDPESVAVIVDEDSPSSYLGHNYEINRWLVYQQKAVFERMGAPWNIYLLDDVVRGNVPKFRTYFFLNCFHMSDAERQWIKTNLQRDGRTLVWMYAPGYVTDSALSVDAMKELTGLTFGERAEELDWRVTFTEDHPLTEGLPRPTQPNMKLGPVFVPQAPGMQTAAVWEGTDIPALVTLEQPQWKSIYSAGPLLAPEMLKRICTMAGVPVTVASTEPSFVSRNMIGLHSAVARTERLRFTEPRTVTDLITGEVLGRKVRELAVPLEGPQTRLLRVE